MIDTLKRLVSRFVHNERAVQVAVAAVALWLAGPSVLGFDIPADADPIYKAAAVAIGVATAAVRMFVYGPQTFDDAQSAAEYVATIARARGEADQLIDTLGGRAEQVAHAFNLSIDEARDIVDRVRAVVDEPDGDSGGDA